MRQQLLWLFGTAGALALLAIHHSTQSEIATLQHQISELGKQRERFSARANVPVAVAAPLPRLEPASASDPARRAPLATVETEPVATAREAEAAATERWQEQYQANQALMEVSFAEEEVESGWMRRARGALQEKLASRLPSTSSLRDIDCRSSTCRVELRHADAEAARTFAMKAFSDTNDPVWSGPSTFDPPEANADGSVTVVMYLGREGTSLFGDGAP